MQLYLKKEKSFPDDSRTGHNVDLSVPGISNVPKKSVI